MILAAIWYDFPSLLVPRACFESRTGEVEGWEVKILRQSESLGNFLHACALMVVVVHCEAMI